MKRDLAALDRKHFDLLIVGGGIYGVCAAWDAALRGLSVALIDKNDFGSATSSNSLKIIHGGLRYVQHADFKRMRESIAERTTLMRIAPHLVHPLPCVMPCYGHALKGREVMAIAFLINDLVGFDRNHNLDPSKHIPRCRIASKDETLQIMPGINQDGLTGGAIWHDAQVYNSERMLMSIVCSAQAAGAVLANHVEMTDFLIEKNKVRGVKARDAISGDTLEISAEIVLNNAGPWFRNILDRMNGTLQKPDIKMSAAMNLVCKKKLFEKYAVGLWSKTTFKDEDAIVSKGSRLLFVAPWRQYSMLGTTHVHFDGEPGKFKVREDDINSFVKEVNDAYPPAELERDDITFFYGGLLPTPGDSPQTGDVKLLKTYRILDHEVDSGIEGFVSVVGVKYTTARDVASRTLDYLVRKMGKGEKVSSTAVTKVHGGDIDNFGEYVKRETTKPRYDLQKSAIKRLIYNYGTGYLDVLSHINENPELARPVAGQTDVLKAEVVHAVREESALTVADVVRRRTELGSAGNPGKTALGCVAEIMAKELNWTKEKTAAELDEVESIYEPAIG